MEVKHVPFVISMIKVEGIYSLLFTDYHLPVNIGNPEEISILDFAKEIIELTQGKSKIIYKDLPVNDPLQRCPDITKARNLLGWEPKVKRKEGMKRTFAYFQGLTQEELHKNEHKNFDKFQKY